MTAAPRREIADRLTRLVTDVRDAARAAQRPELADALVATAGKRADRPTVVVVGEQKRGKSSLINALLGCPGLSPVAVEIATSCYLEFARAAQPVVEVFTAGREDGVRIEAADLARWATVDGELSRGGEGRGPVTRVRVGVDSPLLRRCTLIDTPGVGGLIAGHAEITLRALEHATALLYVLDSDAPLSVPELTFLRRAAEAVDLVVFAQTKIDAYPGWARVVQDNQLRLKEHAPRYVGAPMVGVSSLRYLDAGAHPDPVTRERRLERSGIPALQTTLTEAVQGRLVELAWLNLLRHARSTVTALTRSVREEIALAVADPGVKAALDAERSRLTTFGEEASGFGPRVTLWVSRTRREMSKELTDRQRELIRRQLERIQRGDPVELRRVLEHELQAEMTALALGMQAWLTERVTVMVADIFGELAAEMDTADIAELIRTAAATDPGSGLADSRYRDAGDQLENAMLVVGGASVAALLLLPLRAVGPGAANPVILAGALVAGLGLGLVRAKHHREKAGRQELSTAAKGYIEEIASAIALELGVLADELQYRLGEAVRLYVKRRKVEINEALRRYETAVKQDAATQTAAKTAAGKRLADLQALIARTDALLIEVRRLPARTPAGPDPE